MMKTFAKKPAPVDTPSAKTPSQLMQWPVQIKLVPVNAPYFDGADLLVAADCTAYACGSFHSDFMTGKAVTDSGKNIPVGVRIITTDGNVI